MALSDLQLTLALSATLTKSITGFADDVQGPNELTFTLAGIDLTTFSKLLAADYSIAAAAHVDYDLFSFTDLQNLSTSMTTVLAVIVAPTAGDIVLSPGGSNPLTWFFSGTTPAVKCYENGVFLLCEAVAAVGQTVDATHRNLTLTNNGAGTAAGKIYAIGG